MRNSDSVLLIDCRLPENINKNETLQKDPRHYQTFADNYPESLEIEGTYYVYLNLNPIILKIQIFIEIVRYPYTMVFKLSEYRSASASTTITWYSNSKVVST